MPFYVKKEKMDNFMCLLATPDVMVVGSLTALLYDNLGNFKWYDNFDIQSHEYET